MSAAGLSRPNAITVRHGDHAGAVDLECAGVGVTDASRRQRRARHRLCHGLCRGRDAASSPTTRVAAGATPWVALMEEGGVSRAARPLS